MVYVVMGVLGFAIVHLCDPVAIRRLPLLKPLVWVLGVGMASYAAVMASLWPDKLALPDWSLWLGWVLMLISAVLVVYALFVSLPFRRTYVVAGVGKRLITTGVYALVRHPGVPWSIVFMLSLVLVSRSQLVLIASPIIISLDVLAVTIQDRFLFGRMFPGYDSYRRETPMLIPTRRSFRKFADSLRKVSPDLVTQGGDNDAEHS